MYGFVEYVPVRGGTHDRDLSVFLRAGWADPVVNPIEGYVGSGLVWDGVFRRPTGDRLGLGVATAFLSSNLRSAAAAAGRALDTYEMTWELTYRATPVPWLAVQPGIQYVVNPGGDPALSNALALALRIEIAK